MEIKTYNLTELSKLENKAPITIRKSFRYIPIKIETKRLQTRCKKWEQKTPYSIRYIRLKDIQELLKNDIDFTFVREKKKW